VWRCFLHISVISDGAVPTYTALVVEFSLRGGSYATMALRELTRQDMGSAHQSTLNAYAGVHTTAKQDTESVEENGVEQKVGW
jgi:hypothetical protein